MKITDEQLMKAIWLNQLKRTARGVIDKYAGGRYGLGPKSDTNFFFSCSEHIISRDRITKIISNQQLRNRIKSLINSGKIHSCYGDTLLTFCINTPDAHKAYEKAREVWKYFGLRSGYTNGRANTIGEISVDTITETVLATLIDLYGNCQAHA